MEIEETRVSIVIGVTAIGYKPTIETTISLFSKRLRGSLKYCNQ